MGIHFKAPNEYLKDSDEGFIEMEISSCSNTFFRSKSPTNKEFEFQLMPSSAFPADELFYNGKLLPLHLPPRLQMLQTILHQIPNSNKITSPTKLEQDFLDFVEEEETFSIFQFRNINVSPSESCRVSCELCDDDQCLSEDQWSTPHVRSKKSSTPPPSLSWSTKLKQSSLGRKLIKASRSYLKSLFPHKSAASTSESNQPKNSTFGKRTIASENENISNTITTSHRKSFSGAIQRHNSSSSSSFSNSLSGTSSSSSSFSLSSNGKYSSSYDLQWLKRCSSASLELETSIEGAIAHCKQSYSSLPQGQRL